MKRATAVVAVGAMLLVALVNASIASAVAIEGNNGERVFLKGEGINAQTFGFANGTVSCSTSAFPEDPDYAITYKGKFQEVILLPTYSTCSAFGLGTTVKMNRCALRLRLGAAKEEQFDFYGTPAVECGFGFKQIEAVNTVCTWSLPPQLAGSVSLTKEEVAKEISGIRIKLVGSGLAYTQKGSCGSKESESGTYGGEVRLRGYDEKGNAVSLFIV